MTPNIYDYKVKDLSGREIALAEFKDKVLLIVNTASKCGYTPQYKELETLHVLYSKRGFSVLAFPSNDFGGQEPFSGKEIQQFCDTEYQTTFPIFEKIHIKGIQAHPLFKFMSDRKRNGKVGIAPMWNFHKFLIDRNGRVVDYFLTITNPLSEKIRKKIEALL